jgi:hypothetical protein
LPISFYRPVMVWHRGKPRHVMAAAVHPVETHCTFDRAAGPLDEENPIGFLVASAMATLPVRY